MDLSVGSPRRRPAPAFRSGRFGLGILASALVIAALGGTSGSSASAADSAQAPVARLVLPPENQGPPFVPGTRLVADLPRPYVEEEYFVEGEATLYNYANDPPQGPTDIVPIEADVPYRTRLIVRRPADPRRFNGTVVVEWWNSTAGFDTAPAWDPSADYFARRGIVYVGVTNSTTSLDFLVTGCRLLGLLPPACGTRYATLSLPENGLAYEMMGQIAALLRSDSPDNPLPAAYRVRRLFHVGESQQAGSVITFANAFHAQGRDDGYFVQSGIRGRRINFGPACGGDGVPAFPDCTPSPGLSDSLVRTDLPVPVYQLVTQTDFETLGFDVVGRQPDTKTFRYYEVAGGAHNTVHRDVEIVPAGVFGPTPIFLEDLCANPLNTTADGPVFVRRVIDALWERMQDQTRFGRRPPSGIVMDVVAGVLARDEFDNVKGGVRLPEMEAPTATYVSTNIADPTLPPQLQGLGNLACRLSGSVFPFSQEMLDELYPRRRSYFVEVLRSAIRLQLDGLLLPEDAFEILREALTAEVGGGA